MANAYIISGMFLGGPRYATETLRHADATTQYEFAVKVTGYSKAVQARNKINANAQLHGFKQPPYILVKID